MQFAQAVDFYLSPAGAAQLEDIHEIACQPSSNETDSLLLGCAMEGIRLAGTFGSYREVSEPDKIREDDGREVAVQPGDHVFVSFVRLQRTSRLGKADKVQVSAARDGLRFPNPDEVDPRRPLSSYIHYGVGPHSCLGGDASRVALVEIFRALFRRDNVRRVPGLQGELTKVPRPGGFKVYLKEDWSSLRPFPTSMKIMWDE
jgi:hypothetical protein